MTVDTKHLRYMADRMLMGSHFSDDIEQVLKSAETIDTLREQLAQEQLAQEQLAQEQLTQEQRDHAATKAELARMREALETIGNMPIGTQVWTLKDMARTALKGGTDQ